MRFKAAILVLLLFLPVVAAQQQQQQQSIDPVMLKFISQEHQNTKDYVKEEMDRQLTINHEDIQKQVDFNKGIFFVQFKQELKWIGMKFAVIWFTVTLLAMLVYKIITMKLSKKYELIAKWRKEKYG